MAWCYSWVALLVILVTAVEALVELPKFSQMKLLYPGYFLHGGKYRDKDVIDLIGGHPLRKMHNTASLRLSYALNKYNGRHAMGTTPILLSKRGLDSYTGRDNQEYIFRNTAFGPFLAARYGNPVVAKPNDSDHTKTMAPFIGKQGIVRLVSYHNHHAGGHVGLWDCDHFHESRDWTTEIHIISVEFWESPDSVCPPPKQGTEAPPHRIIVGHLHLIPRTNSRRAYTQEDGRPRQQVWDPERHEYRDKPREAPIWLG